VIFAFLVGDLLGRLGYRPSTDPSKVALLAAQFGLTAFAAALALAWWYETSALASGGSLEPITYYVMCIKNTQNNWTLLIFMLAAVITGRWLWHQPGSRLW
jgi:CDP-diglyceride synthetase